MMLETLDALLLYAWGWCELLLALNATEAFPFRQHALVPVLPQ